MYQRHTSWLTELWSLPRPAKGLNTNNNNNNCTQNGLWGEAQKNFTFSSLLHPLLSNQIVLLFSSPFLTSFPPEKVNSGTLKKKRDFYHYRDRSLVPRLPIPNSGCSLQTPVRPITVNLFTGMRASESLWSVRKIILSPLVQGSLMSGNCPGTPCYFVSRLRLKCDGTRVETRFCPSAKRTSPFKSAGASVQSTTGSRGVRNRGSDAG